MDFFFFFFPQSINKHKTETLMKRCWENYPSSLISPNSLLRAQWWCQPRVEDAMFCCGMAFPWKLVTWKLVGNCFCISLLTAWSLDPWRERDTGDSIFPHSVTPATMSWHMRVPSLFLDFFQRWISLLLSPIVTILPAARNSQTWKEK